MSWSSLSRARRIAVAAGSLTTVCVAVGLLAVILSVGLPQAWWPDIGNAFAADASPQRSKPCAGVVGPAKEYCLRAATASAGNDHHRRTGLTCSLVLVAIGLAVLVVCRCRGGRVERGRG